MALLTNHFQLTKTNKHLADIFSENYYLELGNLNTNALSKLLKNKLVRYSDLTYFEIQNKGIGTSEIENKKLKEKIPYFYFENFSHKDINKQLFITYGIIVQRKGYKEYFTPIILLPVNILIDNSDVWFKMNGSPIENPYLPYRKFVDTDKEKFKDIYDIDSFCIDTFKQDKHNLRLESYLTVADVYIPNSSFSNEKFSLEGIDSTKVESGFNLNRENGIYNITSLNQKQRNCLEEASYGNSFAISGVLGTGKTTTLANIASNAIHNNKKVLYVSNNEETLDEVYNLYKSKGLESLIMNLNRIHLKNNEKYQLSKLEDQIDKIVKEELETKYDGIKDYTKLLYEKINDFRFLDIVKGLIEYKDAENNLDQDALTGINSIYRLEANEISKALDIIDDNLGKIESFKNSKFNNIPIRNSSTVEEITSMIKGLRNNYIDLIEKKRMVEKEYGFSTIPNYAYFRNIINNYVQLDKSLIPSSWLEYNLRDCKKKNLVNYEKAKELFLDFSTEIMDANQKEETLKNEYNTKPLDNIDIHYSINLILSKFEGKSNEEINDYLKNNKRLLNDVNNLKPVMDECEYNFGKMRDKIGVKVNYRDTEEINQIVPFIQFFGSNKIPKIWLDTKNSDGIRKKIISVTKQLEDYEEHLAIYNTYFVDINNIDNNIIFLEKKAEKSDKFKGANIKDLIDNLKKFKSLSINIDDAYKQYYSLTLEEFPCEELLPRFDTFNQLLKNIKDERIQNKLVKNLNSLKDQALEEFIKPFIVFSDTYTRIMNFFDELESYSLVNEGKNLPDKMSKIIKAGEYCEKILFIQDNMNQIIKRDLAYVPYQEYLILASKIENLVVIRTKIDKNEKYKYLYGPMFKGYMSSLEEITKELSSFGQYINIFNDNDAIKASTDKEIGKEIDNILNSAFNTCESVNELIKDYSKTFRDGTGKYYYDNMDSIVEYDKVLLDETNELKTYLKITRGMQVLLKHKLYNFNEYIINHDKELFKARFMNAYFRYLYNEFVKVNPFVQNGEGFYKLIEDVIDKEEELCSSNVYDIKLHHLPHSVVGAYHGNLEKYMKRAKEIKSLFFANTKTMNAYLDMNWFDLVLIDDANLSESDEYTKALSCNQVIFAGIYNIRVGIYNDILTKIKNNAIIELNERYITSPLSLVGHMERCLCDFYGEMEKNDGTEVTNEDICNLIITLITQDMTWDESFRVKLNKDIKINCFVSNLEKVKRLFDEIASSLASLNISLEDIYYVLRKQVNITDLHKGYLWNSEYNIIDLSDYNEDNDIYENKNLISNLICAKKKLYIVDSDNLLKNEEKTGFVKCIDELLDVKNIIHPIEDKSCLRLAQTLTHHKIHVLGTYRNYDILIQKNQKNYGIIIYNAPSNYGRDILNTYRDHYYSEFPCSIIYINDLVDDYYGCIKKIIGDAKNE